MIKNGGQSGPEGALEFLRSVADAEQLSAEVQRGDVNRTVEIARERGFEFEVKDVWDAITDLQKRREELAGNVPSWIIDRLRVAVHD